MPISMGLATIIGAVIAAGSSIIGGAVNSHDVDEANKIGLRLAEQRRQDELRVQAANERMNMLGLKQRRKEFRWQKGEAEKARLERKEQFEYGKRQGFDAKNMNMVNQNAQLRSTFMQMMTRR